jgi:hypothetical protein
MLFLSVYWGKKMFRIMCNILKVTPLKDRGEEYGGSLDLKIKQRIKGL